MKLKSLFAVTIMLAASVGAALPEAQTTETSPDTANRQRVVWATFPDLNASERYYPKKARRNNIGGIALIDCAFDDPLPGETTSVLKNCDVLEEYPKGMGFGDATVNMLQHYNRVEAEPGKELKAGRFKLSYRWEGPNRRLQPESMEVAFLPDTHPADYYPVKALSLKKAGQVKLNCTYKRTEGDTAAITDCEVQGESPKGLGFGEQTATLFKERGRVTFGGPKLAFPWEGQIEFAYDWTPPAGE